MRRRLSLVSTVALASLLLSGCVHFEVDEATTAVINGQGYVVTVARGLVVTGEDLIPYGRVERVNDPNIFLDDQAFALTDVDGQDFLVVRAKPGLRDDAGSWGDYIGLLGPNPNRAVCHYFVRLAPTWCDDG